MRGACVAMERREGASFQIVGWEAVIEPRIYRAAFVPALLAVVLVMFSLESRPKPLPQGLAADIVFDGDQAVSTTRSVLAAGRDRRAGTAGDRAASELVAAQLERRGFTVRREGFESDGAELVNVVGRRAGRSRRQIVVVAARDAGGVPDAAGSAADTAALLEIARVFQGRPSEKTFVLASVDGSKLGELGTARLAGALGDPGLVDGVVVISGLGTRTRAPAAIEPWAGDTTRAGVGLVRTATESLRDEQGSAPEGSSPAGQLARLAFPIGVGAQGVLLEAGYDAVRIAGDGELGHGGRSTIEVIDEERLERLGRVALRTLTALDAGPRPEHGPDSYVTVVSQVVPGWVIDLLAFTLVLPALVASVDAFARARRRQEPVAAWLTWLLARVLPFALALVVAHGLALARATPEPPGAPVAPAAFPLDGPAAAVLGGVALVAALSWLLLSHFVRTADPRLRDPSAPGAAVVVALALSLAALALWAINPYSALILAPALHLWLLGTLFDPPPPRRARVAMVLGGLLLPALVAAYYLELLSLDPLSGSWYLLLLVLWGHVSTASALVGCVMAGVLVSVAAIARAQPPPPPPGVRPVTPSVRGPAGYAGPGSLGGTDSALPRR